jgi:hypothetical protein
MEVQFRGMPHATTGSSWEVLPIGLNRLPTQRRFRLSQPRRRPETASMWQACHGANYKSAYAAVSAGEMSLVPILGIAIFRSGEAAAEKAEPSMSSRARTPRPTREKMEDKTVKPVGNTHPRSIEGMLQFLPFVFQPSQSRDLHNLSFRVHRRRTARRPSSFGMPPSASMMVCRLSRSQGHADSQTWLGFLRKNAAWFGRFFAEKFASAGPQLLLAFGKCFQRRCSASTDPLPNQSRLRPSLSILE